MTWIRDRALTLALMGMFLVFLVASDVLPAPSGAHRLSDVGPILVQSFQNWQSEFLAIASMVWLAVYLRQRWSPESKPVHAPHAETRR